MFKGLFKFFGNLILIVFSFYIALIPSSFIFQKIFRNNCGPVCPKGNICITIPVCKYGRTFGLDESIISGVLMLLVVLFTVLIDIALRFVIETLIKKIKERK